MNEIEVEKDLERMTDGEPPANLRAIVILFAKALLILLRRSK